MALLFRRDEGRWFLRCFPTHPTEAAAQEAAKDLWLAGNAVRVWPGRRGVVGLAGDLTGILDPGARAPACNNLLQGDRRGVTNCNICMCSISGRETTGIVYPPGVATILHSPVV